MTTAVIVQLETQLQWQAAKSEASGRWIGVCDAMNLSMEADSLDQLHSLISETLQLVFIDLLEDNELERFLRDRGWRAANLPSGHDATDVEFEVPWEMVVPKGTHDSERRPH